MPNYDNWIKLNKTENNEEFLNQGIVINKDEAPF